MAVFVFGSELDVFNPLTVNCIETAGTAAAFDAARSRCAIQLGIVSGPTTGLVSPDFSSNVLWVKFTLYTTVGTPNNAVFEIRDAALQTLFRMPPAGGDYQPQYWNGAAFVNTGTTFRIPSSQRVTYDVNINFLTGGFAIYQGGVLISTGSGWAGTAGFVATRMALLSFGGGVASFATEIVIANEDTRNFRVITVPAVAAGASTAFTGTVADINEIVLNDTNFISSAVSNQIEQFTIATPSLNSLAIKAVGIGRRALSNGGAPTLLEANIRLAGVDYFSASFNPGAALLGGTVVFANNPATALPWVPGDITAANMQFGFASRP